VKWTVVGTLVWAGTSPPALARAGEQPGAAGVLAVCRGVTVRERALNWVVGLSGLVCAQGTDIVLADFEGEGYGDWKVAGTAFGPGPARGTLRNQMHVEGYKGKGLVNTFFDGDGSTGTLSSPEFAIERKYLAFLIGGGKDPEKLAIRLIVDGRIVRWATGPNDQPGGSESLAQSSWDVSELAGKSAVIQIVDQATGPWGHVNVDQIVQTDRRPPGLRANAERAFAVASRYLNLPIKNGATKRVVTLVVDGKPVVRNDIALADHEPDWWAPMDVSAWSGKTVVLRVDQLPEDSAALTSIVPADVIKGAENLYKEPLRGQFHFSPRRGWNNDPNGLVYYNGEYHLFFQHNPYGWDWGNMHWGHAVSKDLVHWEELGDVLWPDELGPMFSGSAVVDHANTSGFGEAGRPPLVLIYTAAGNPTVQCVAYSTDGRAFTKCARNPVVKQVTGGNRDPKVMWHAPSRKWVMVLYVMLKGRHTIHFFTSSNLTDWTLASVAEGGTDGKDGYLFECPDFFKLAVDGANEAAKWCLLGANGEYALGAFDGTTFKPDRSWLPGQRGKGFYAPQTFSDLPAADGRRIQIGWFQTATPGMPFNQSMSIPLELKLTATADGPRMTWTPVKELESLRAKSHVVSPRMLEPGDGNPLADLRGELLELRAEFAPARDAEVAFNVRGATVAYDARTQELVVNGHRARAPLKQGQQRLTIYVDRTGLEVFGADGLTYLPMPHNADPANQGLSVGVKGAAARVTSLEVHELRSAWTPK
jgi:sucrose-6-phosphate hydrolase SacC (GH32 family)